MRTLRSVVAVLLIWSTVAYAQGNSWDKVRYNGGTLQTKVSPKDWDNHLTVTSDQISLKLKDGQTLDIPTGSVTSLSYGQEAHRRVGTMVAAAGIGTQPQRQPGAVKGSRSLVKVRRGFHVCRLAHIRHPSAGIAN